VCLPRSQRYAELSKWSLADEIGLLQSQRAILDSFLAMWGRDMMQRVDDPREGYRKLLRDPMFSILFIVILIVQIHVPQKRD
jgi:hypothetical protein